MTGAIVASWGNSVRGRESKSLEVFGKALAHFEALAKQGRVHSHKEYIALTGNASRLSGFQIIEGEVEELQKILIEDDFRTLQVEASAIVENFTVTLYAGGSDRTVQELITRYAEATAGLGYL
jgi:hypothetical protein